MLFSKNMVFRKCLKDFLWKLYIFLIIFFAKSNASSMKALESRKKVGIIIVDHGSKRESANKMLLDVND
jgi:hypothetical protein